MSNSPHVINGHLVIPQAGYSIVRRPDGLNVHVPNHPQVPIYYQPQPQPQQHYQQHYQQAPRQHVNVRHIGAPIYVPHKPVYTQQIQRVQVQQVQPTRNKCQHGHKRCDELYESRADGSRVAGLIINKHKDFDNFGRTTSQTYCAILGLKRGNNRSCDYTLPEGKLINSNNGCFLSAIEHIILNSFKFKPDRRNIKMVFNCDGVAVIVYEIDGFSRIDINSRIESVGTNPFTRADKFRLSDLTELDGKYARIDPLAKKIVKRYDKLEDIVFYL
jgi:hypothetical protein